MGSDPASPAKGAPGLKKIGPYWYPYTTMAKGRWFNREILEVVSTEFRDRSMEYYRYALESGMTTINGKVAKPDTVVRNGDRIENVVHRHEPPVTSAPIKILYHDVERDFIVIDKPGSIPIHPTGRYFRNTLVEILQDDFGYTKAYPVNRLDRLTSGLMIIPLTADCARLISEEFTAGTVRKEYVARVQGEFPSEEVICEEPLLTVDRQTGLNIIHPEGKHAKTIFNRLHYDANTDSSVVHCQPMTGRSHQLRVHLQYLGYPIANDPVYSDRKIWGPKLGKGGVDILPSEIRAAPAPPPHIEVARNPETLSTPDGLEPNSASSGPTPPLPDTDQLVARKLLPRETGHDIGMGSPVPLSAETVTVITRLRSLKDEDEDWSRWRDVVFRAKGRLSPPGMKIGDPPPQNRRKRGGATLVQEDIADTADLEEQPSQLSIEEALQRSSLASPPASTATEGNEELKDDQSASQPEGSYCSECYLPLHPDPLPEKLYIFLHALRYTTSLGCYETDMPQWAQKGWEWDRS